MDTLKRRLISGPPLLMDAATGTALLAMGLDPIAAVQTHKAALISLHASHVKAGAEVIVTATFSSRTTEACRQGVEAARLAGANYVLGSIGPCRREELFEIAQGFQNADGILLETFSSPEGLERAAQARDYLDESIAVLLSLTYRRHLGQYLTFHGDLPENMARRAANYGITALGVNCGLHVTPEDCAAILQRYRSECNLPLFARPNAGSPVLDSERRGEAMTIGDDVTPRRLAEVDWSGAAMVGGCCGTTTAHVAALRSAFAKKSER
ncbi:MAG: hypothetical protein EBV06_14200 [Planctomycetia bacterium]|nr:hypothetical protein [Planctomycetia bacterium]